MPTARTGISRSARSTVDVGEDISLARPGRPATSTSHGPTGASSEGGARHGPLDDLQPLPPSHRDPRSSSSSMRRSYRRSSSRPVPSVDTSDEPEALRLTDHHELDLEHLIREAIQLAEPIAPVCRPDCPGLCAVCGADLSRARARPPRGADRPASGGPAGVRGRREHRNRLDSRLGPRSARRPAADGRDLIDRPRTGPVGRSARPADTAHRGAPRTMGVPKRKVSSRPPG